MVRSEPPTVTVVGGGPTGLMAAEIMAEAGVSVTVFDRMRSPGRKLQLAGRGGLNITHSEDLEIFLERYGPDRGHIEPAISTFGPAQLREWCASLGEPTFVGSSGRVFPASFGATRLLRAWLHRLDSLGVSLRTGHRWLGWARDTEGVVTPGISRFSGPDGSIIEVESDATVIALGGASWPRSGSDGGWVGEFDRCGVDVAPLRPANCGVRVEWTEIFARKFAGVPLKNVAVDVGGVPTRGDAVVTASGLEGGPVYANSRRVRHALDAGGAAELGIDLQPDLSVGQLVVRLGKKRRPKDSLSTWLRRSGFASVEVSLMRESTGNKLPSNPEAMARLAKAVPVRVIGQMSIDRAISTAGGVSFHEIDERFMLERMPGVFVAGEMLDWEAPTGGYLLQASFATGVAAARGALGYMAAEAGRYPRG